MKRLFLIIAILLCAASAEAGVRVAVRTTPFRPFVGPVAVRGYGVRAPVVVGSPFIARRAFVTPFIAPRVFVQPTFVQPFYAPQTIVVPQPVYVPQYAPQVQTFSTFQFSY